VFVLDSLIIVLYFLMETRKPKHRWTRR